MQINSHFFIRKEITRETKVCLEEQEFSRLYKMATFGEVYANRI